MGVWLSRGITTIGFMRLIVLCFLRPSTILLLLLIIIIMMAAQDQAISTNYFNKKMLKQEIESRCWLCKEYKETIDHLTSGCPTLAKNEYIIRHDKVCTHLHYSICEKLGIETAENWYSHIPKPVTEHEDVSLLWNQGI
jgi:hypothetical protein